MVSLLTGPQMSQQMHMELVYGKASVNFGQSLLGTSHLELAMDLTSNFGRTYGWETTLGEEFPSLHLIAIEPNLPLHPTDQTTVGT